MKKTCYTEEQIAFALKQAETGNRAVANQLVSGSNARWKWTTEYNRRSVAETAM